MRVVDDPVAAQEIVLAIKTAEARQRYPDAPQAGIDKLAGMAAASFVRDMEPSAANGQDPLRLIRVESADGSPVSPGEIYEAARFRTEPGTGKIFYAN